MYKKPDKSDSADERANNTENGKPESGADLFNGNFELWLEQQLAELEARYESFVTVSSIREFFNHKSR
jgi:hypothetical protein